MIAAIFVFFGVKVTKGEKGDMVSTKASFDFPGAAALIVFLSSLILVLSLGKLAPFGGMVSNVLWIVCAMALISLIIVMKKKKARAIVPTTVLSDRNTLSLLIFTFFINMSMMCLYVFMPLYAMYELKQSPAMAGLLVTCYGIATLFMSPVYGRLIAKAANARSVAVLSAAIRIAALMVLIILLKPTTSMYLVFTLMFILGFSQSGGTVVSAVAAMIQIPEEKRQLGNAVVQLGPSMGATIGIAVYSAVIGAAGITNGMTTSLIISTAASAIVLCSGLLLRKLPVPAEANR
jgi:predicted MFS family arabinose efflux permease